MWTEGRIEVRGITFHYWVKVYDEGSVTDQRRSDLQTHHSEREDRSDVANYDRGWDIKPKTQSAQKVVDTLLERYAG